MSNLIDVKCPECDGTGWERDGWDESDGQLVCWECDGAGTITIAGGDDE